MEDWLVNLLPVQPMLSRAGLLHADKKDESFNCGSATNKTCRDGRRQDESCGLRPWEHCHWVEEKDGSSPMGPGGTERTGRPVTSYEFLCFA
jgi:hypothetical protein